jgi:predicted nuclease of predicted toxin-antitoxin system
MRILLDTCVWGGAADALRTNGHDVVWSGDWDEDPGDEEILALAHADRRILITLDKDFGELAILRRIPHCGILRIVGFPARGQAAVIQMIVSAHGPELEAGAFITVDQKRIRIRPAEGNDPLAGTGA